MRRAVLVLLLGLLAAGWATGAAHRPAHRTLSWSAGPGEGLEDGRVVGSVLVQATGERVDITFVYSRGEPPPLEAISFRNTVFRETFVEHPAHSQVTIGLSGAWGFDPGEHPGERFEHELVDRVTVEAHPDEGMIALVLDLHHPVGISFAASPASRTVTVVLARGD